MSSDDYKTAVKLLPRLSSQELTDLRLRLDAFLKIENRSAAAQAATDQDDWLLYGIEFELRRRALWNSGPLPRKLLPADWSGRSKLVRDLLLKKMKRPAGIRAAEKTALGQVAARALAEYVAQGGVPLGPRVILSRVDQVPAAVESAFPGYLNAGLLPFCWGAWGTVSG